MSYLLYCIFRGGSPQVPTPAAGVNGQAVEVVEYGGLGAGVSQLRQPELPPDIASLLAYERVVESFFSRRTIIPMRYGCKLQDRPQLEALLWERRPACDVLLDELEGLVEMGVRAEDVAGPDPDPEPARGGPAGRRPWRPSGADYLLAQKQHYDRADRNQQRRDERVKALCQPLAGLFVRHAVESSPGGAGALSVYFLVPRNRVEEFRQAIGGRPPDGLRGLAVSGPWPPYNFVSLAAPAVLREA